jgi:hypothetical protein
VTEGNIEMDHKCECADWIQIAQYRIQWWAVRECGSDILDYIKTGNYLISRLTNFSKKDPALWQ